MENITTEADRINYGVSEPSQVEVAGQILPKSVEVFNLFGVTYKVRRHPDLLRMKHIDLWIKKYEHWKRAPAYVDDDDCHLCWLELVDQYEEILKGFEYEQLNS